MNGEIQWPNIRRKAYADSTRLTLEKMQTTFDKKIKTQDKILSSLHAGEKSLHEGQIIMEYIMRMLIKKMGLVPQPVQTQIPKVEMQEELHDRDKEGEDRGEDDDGSCQTGIVYIQEGGRG